MLFSCTELNLRTIFICQLSTSLVSIHIAMVLDNRWLIWYGSWRIIHLTTANLCFSENPYIGESILVFVNGDLVLQHQQRLAISVSLFSWHFYFMAFQPNYYLNSKHFVGNDCLLSHIYWDIVFLDQLPLQVTHQRTIFYSKFRNSVVTTKWLHND